MTDTDTKKVDQRSLLADSDTEHYVCCYHDHVSYCGLTLSDPASGWADDDEIDCVVCLDLSVVDDETGGMFCPAEPYCRFATGEGPDIP